MKNKLLLALAVILVLIGIGAVVLQNQGHIGSVGGAKSNTVTFLCDNTKSIKATFYPDNDTGVDLILSDGRTLSVPHAISADGARYANSDESFVFWNKGNTAFITEGATTTFANCAIPDNTAVNTQVFPNSTSTDDATFQYPDSIPTKYIQTVDWPPQVQVSNHTFSCTEGGKQVAQAGQTAKQTINGHDYCVTKESEGAAGSIYTNYAYGFGRGDKTVYLIFSLRAPQCANYDDPSKTECQTEHDTFSIDGIVDQIAQTLILK